MINIILFRTAGRLRAGFTVQSHLRSTICSVRYASVNTAINRGIRRSKGVGFRGKEKTQSQDAIEDRLVRRSANSATSQDASRNLAAEGTSRQPRRSAETGSHVKIRKGKREIKDDRGPPPRRSRAARFYDPNSSFGKKSIVYQEKLANGELRTDARSARGTKRASDRSTNKRTSEEDKSQWVSKKNGELGYGKDENSKSQRSSERERNQPSYQSQAPREYDIKPAVTSSPVKPRFSKTIDNRIPLSIPYTTTASEFLYGTSVVEAALKSHRVPRRKLYKLYVYTGENRDKIDRDIAIEHLARRNGVEVVHAGPDWLRLMDKMSRGRPHNGYILEASPLPKLPVTSLGELVSNESNVTGFNVQLDYQSREEATINGTENFIPFRPSVRGRKPFVLLLDSIEDPGNLGGIIRTASFLGVTAVAISTRNSASFTPVVLKASAGASENINLFSVSKPAGFVADSKLAGWKVYGAVAPSRDSASTIPNITTAELDDPLSEDPCLLILGNEGEGIRRNLRSKADVELAIQGTAQRYTVDSLNVSVATGILCDAFLRRRAKTKYEPLVEKAERGSNSTSIESDLF
ncbi:hypothetical protein B7463_g6438, partial [Scytalidium lignicola]